MMLELQPIVFTIGEVQFSIPFYFYTNDVSRVNDEENDREEGDVENRCYLLLKENESLGDDSFTLGLPFLNPYMVMLDFTAQKVGF